MSEISVVIPVHNGMPFVLDAVSAALAQREPPAEIIVIDDASTDGTGDALRERFGERVRVVPGTHGSAAAARNAGWREATRPWIAFLDADDLWFDAKTRVARQTLAEHPAAAWFFSDGTFLTLDGVLHASWLKTYADLPDGWVGHPVGQLIEVNFILTSSVVVRRDLLVETGGFDERLSHAEDVDLWIRLARRWKACASREPLVRYQHREGGLTRQIEKRLEGDVALFSRLAGDATLAPAHRGASARRAGLARYKLAVAALREGRGRDARRRLAEAGQAVAWPARAATWWMSFMPPPIVRAFRSQRWATRGLAARTLRLKRVRLDALDPGTAPGERGRP